MELMGHERRAKRPPGVLFSHVRRRSSVSGVTRLKDRPTPQIPRLHSQPTSLVLTVPACFLYLQYLKGFDTYVSRMIATRRRHARGTGQHGSAGPMRGVVSSIAT